MKSPDQRHSGKIVDRMANKQLIKGKNRKLLLRELESEQCRACYWNGKDKHLQCVHPARGELCEPCVKLVRRLLRIVERIIQ